ncbi:MAG: SHOCT domain-containing protein [Candidatus Dormibacteraeota bacterium]|nr:SHOCT domain-containing protein [Candidatus Dormibacteraeota bacterium]
MTWLGLLMMGFGLLVFAGIILFAVWAVTRLTSSERGQSSGTANSAEDPLVILQRRYARGEIGREDYERIRSDLQSLH